MSQRFLASFRRSLRARLLLGTLFGMCVALIIAGFVLTNYFSRFATKQFQTSMQIHLDRLTANFELNSEGKPILSSPMSDPRFTQPFSGLYWQINDDRQIALARSRSLWDEVINVPRDAMSKDATNPSTLHIHQAPGPDKSKLMVLERNIKLEGYPNQVWQLIIAASTDELEHSIDDWTRRLIFFLSLLFLTLTLAAIAQVLISLAPLRTLQKALENLRGGPLRRLEGSFPQEVQPLIDDFNKVLDHSVQVVERARAQTGDLAHSLKTPLAVLTNAASRSHQTVTDHEELARLVKEQVSMMQRHIDWRLQRARTAATAGMPVSRTPVQQKIEQLIRVMKRVHADRELTFGLNCSPEDLVFNGEGQDFQEMLGNVLDNASKWAQSQVHVDATGDVAKIGRQLVIMIDDDGPGLEQNQYDKVLQRGIRVDEMTPGTGLGLAIVKELVDLYDGEITLAHSPLGGLRVILSF